jgi:hypothetical protein
LPNFLSIDFLNEARVSNRWGNCRHGGDTFEKFFDRFSIEFVNIQRTWEKSLSLAVNHINKKSNRHKKEQQIASAAVPDSVRRLTDGCGIISLSLAL